MSVKVIRSADTELRRNQKVVSELKVSGRWGKKYGLFGCPPSLRSGYARRLRDFDPEITCWFNQIVGRWQLYWNGKKLMTVRDEDGGYKHPDGYTIYQLRKGDSRVRGWGNQRPQGRPCNSRE